MPSAVDICNMALSRLGDEANVSSIDPADDSVQAHYCSTFYPLALTTALDQHDWGFATRRKALSLRGNEAEAEWGYCFGVPSDYLHLVKLTADGLGSRAIAYSIEVASDNNLVLYSNLESLSLVYVSSAVSSAHFPPTFVHYLSALLAHYLAGPILKGDVGASSANKMLELARELKKTAIERDTQNQHLFINHQPATLTARL